MKKINVFITVCSVCLSLSILFSSCGTTSGVEKEKPEVAEEFEKRFMEQNGDNMCASLIIKRRLHGKNCNDLVGETASIIESLL